MSSVPRAFGLSRRRAPLDRIPSFAIHTSERATIVGLASAWGFWGGTDAERPAVEALVQALADASSPERGESIEAAFVAVTRALDRMPSDEELDALGSRSTCLLAAVATADAITLAWLGTLVAARVREGEIVARTEPHTTFRELAATHPRELIEQAAALYPLRTMAARFAAHSGERQWAVEQLRWPALRQGERLLLTSLRTLEAACARGLPDQRDASAWLEALLDAGADASWDPVAVIIEPFGECFTVGSSPGPAVRRGA